jgi:hypothetical protein
MRVNSGKILFLMFIFQMEAVKLIIRRLKPGISKRYLLFVAALVWTFAGGMLFFRGFSMLVLSPQIIWLKIIGCILAGMLFYRYMFSKISFKHIQRIMKMKSEKPCFFSFFNLRGYLTMAFMICMGIVLRTSGIVPVEYLSMFYVVMGVPLTVSAFRFYFHCIYYKSAIVNVAQKNSINLMS